MAAGLDDQVSYSASIETLVRREGFTPAPLERRAIQTSTELNHYVDFPHVGQVFRLQRSLVTQRTGKAHHEVKFGTSLSPERADASRLMEHVRGHWGIENKVHYVRDVTFDEDRSQLRKLSAGHLMASFRNLAISVLRLAGCSNIAQALRRLAGDRRRPFALLGI